MGKLLDHRSRRTPAGGPRAWPPPAATAAALLFVPVLLLSMLVMSSFGPLNDLDESVARWLHARTLARSGCARFLNTATDALGPTLWRVLVALAGLRAWLRGARRLAVWAIVTIAVSGLLNSAIKEVVHRPRPALPDPISWASGLAFPSGHAAAAATGTCLLVLMLLPSSTGGGGRGAAWSAAALITAFVAYTRLALGVHWLSDVIAGAALGTACVAAAALAPFGPARGTRSVHTSNGFRSADPPDEDQH